MNSYHYEILLRSDAEPASGLGGELLNSMLPRNAANQIVIPAAHLKGLMREHLHNLLQPFRQDAEKVCSHLFGSSGEEDAGAFPGILHLTDAVAEENASVLTITRTKLENGRAKDQSLRTSEALAVGSVLKGTIHCDSSDPMVLKFCRLALLSVFSLGGGRSRGAGACRITISEHPEETPGTLLRDVGTAALPDLSSPIRYVETGHVGSGVKALKLHLEMEMPLCLPERPAGKNNVISSGFVIQGTALAGTLLTLLSRKDPELSSACFRSESFRCFPLLPVVNSETCLMPVFVSNTHKTSKVPQEDLKTYVFGDLMIPDSCLEENYRWEQKASRLSMKGTDGVLLVRDGHVELLKAGEIPRLYTAHGVVNGSGEKKDNLFTMESVCVKEFSGLVILPEKGADQLLAELKNGRKVFFGKAKSTMGAGILCAEEWTLYSRIETDFPQVPSLKNRLFIVQTPIVYENAPEKNSREILNEILKDAGWGEVEKESVMTDVLFGWNRLGLGSQIGSSGRVKAKRVIRPGSVFLLKDPLTGLPEKLAAGLGTDRYAGYGAVLPHPMFATTLCRMPGDAAQKVTPKRRSNLHPVYCGYQLDNLCKTTLSASQIARLLRCVQVSSENAETFMKNQEESRPERIWTQWKPVFGYLETCLKEYSQPEMVEMIRVWHDLRIGRNER